MALDWFTFLRQHNIPYTTSGPNASRGRVNIKCPFCGSNDPSEHMGINLNGKGWSCWRNKGHAGTTPERLIAHLLKVSIEEARQLAGGGLSVPTDRDLVASIREKLGGRLEQEKPRERIPMAKEFHSLADRNRFADQFLDYLRERGYGKSQLQWLVDTYDLRYALRGKFAYRVIIPVYDRHDNLLTWTGRSILPDEELRYKSLRAEEQVCSPKETLLGLPLLWNCANARALVIVEGPFDAFWVTAWGRQFGVYATCLFGLSMSSQQMNLILALRSRFKKQVVMLDAAAKFQTFRMAQSGIGLGVERLADVTKDPATVPATEMVDLCARIAA